MVNYNGELLQQEVGFLNQNNRGLRYGDSLFETLRAVNGKLFFWEDHYFRLMAAMRMLRMEIPMDFTMEFLETKIQDTLAASNLNEDSARVRLSIIRKDGGLYLPKTNEIDYLIEVLRLESPFYILEDGTYEIELFKDFFVNTDSLSTLKTNNKILNVVGSIFAQENGYQNCLLLNTKKQVVEALNGNVFLVNGNTIKTPPLNDGCLNGIIRKKLMGILNKLDGYTLEEASISPFELQKADELFVTNSIVGIRPVTKYRKKEYGSKVAKDLIGKLNAAARLG